MNETAVENSAYHWSRGPSESRRQRRVPTLSDSTLQDHPRQVISVFQTRQATLNRGKKALSRERNWSRTRSITPRSLHFFKRGYNRVTFPTLSVHNFAECRSVWNTFPTSIARLAKASPIGFFKRPTGFAI